MIRAAHMETDAPQHRERRFCLDCPQEIAIRAGRVRCHSCADTHARAMQRAAKERRKRMAAGEIAGLVTVLPLCAGALAFWLAVFCAGDAEAAALDAIIYVGRGCGAAMIGTSIALGGMLALNFIQHGRRQ